MKKIVLVMCACFATQYAVASTGADVSLRAADEPTPANRPWDQGASIAYQNINGSAAWQTDAVVKAAYSWDQQLAAKPGEPAYTGGGIRWQVSAGPYAHKFTGSNKPQNDRGMSVGLGGHVVPGGSAEGAVVDYDFGLTLSQGRKLTSGTGAYAGTNFDVDSDRQIVSAAMYYQPVASLGSDWVHFFRLSVKGYSDNLSRAQDIGANGRVNGAMAGIQYSLAPLGLDPMKHQLGALGLAPVLTLSAQSQHDTSATGGRTPGNHRLYAATLSFPLTNNNDKEYKGPVPSLDIKRSTGADLLAGRESKGQTSITLSVKY